MKADAKNVLKKKCRTTKKERRLFRCRTEQGDLGKCKGRRGGVHLLNKGRYASKRNKTGNRGDDEPSTSRIKTKKTRFQSQGNEDYSYEPANMTRKNQREPTQGNGLPDTKEGPRGCPTTVSKDESNIRGSSGREHP